jgi:hypothetical protein
MLVPDETLSGWPAVADPSILQTLGLLVGLPLVVIIIVFLVAKAGNVAKAGRQTDRQVTDPVWLGGRKDGDADSSGDVPALESSTAGAATRTAEEETGGAGARW